MHRKIIFSTTLIIGLILAACGGAAETTTTAPVNSSIDAAAIYNTSCVGCHGASREGVSGLGKPLTPDALADRSDSEIRDIIAQGKSGTAMRPFQGALSGAEIDAVVQFIKTAAP